jgi:pimeloyl-ACP methyl ester carboxylesterase
MKLLLVLVGLVAVLLGAVVVYDGAPSTPNDFVEAAASAADGAHQTRSFVRHVERVPIHSEFYDAWLYLPLASKSSTNSKPPVIIMGPGLAAQKDFNGFTAYAERFVAEGWAVFLFDYRNFGRSEGRTRNLIDPIRHVQDYHAAVVHLVNTDLTEKVDVTRMAFWGSSFSGGHVLVAASEFEAAVKAYPLNYILNQRPENLNRTKPQLKAIFSQVPHLDPNAVIPTLDLVQVARGFALAIADWVGSWFGLTVYIRVYGTPEQVAILNTPEATEYGRLVPEKPAGGWVNKAPARSIIYISRYRPLDYVASISTPVLMIAANNDTLCPISAVNEAEKLLSNGEVIKYDVGHFDFYEGKPHFAETLDQQIRFFHKHL